MAVKTENPPKCTLNIFLRNSRDVAENENEEEKKLWDDGKQNERSKIE